MKNKPPRNFAVNFRFRIKKGEGEQNNGDGGEDAKGFHSLDPTYPCGIGKRFKIGLSERIGGRHNYAGNDPFTH